MRCFIWISVFASVFSGLIGSGHGMAEEARVDFQNQVRPILAKHCLTCHGPDEEAREAGLRLDRQEGSREDLGGYQAIQPGRAEDSELIQRVESDDPDLRMPPAESHPPLSSQQIEVLRRWIEEGGEYQDHWAFQAPEQKHPKGSSHDWSKHVIDDFVRARQMQAGFDFTSPAGKTDWLRRVHLDLSGTPPSPDEVERFLSDNHPLAQRRVVDRLLANPDFGEHFAVAWLDLARYADTNGYEKDRPRTIWPYRDWVINAINSDMPFDQFSIEQLAGDMLPHATDDQRVATGFHRNTMLNEEGGIDPLEYRWLAIVDRVATTGTTWLGLTTGCAQCHTHKYDPITHTDYYQLFALLNQSDEPELEYSDGKVSNQATQSYESAIESIDQQLKQLATGSDADSQRFQQRMEQDQLAAQRTWTKLRPSKWTSTMPKLKVLPDHSILASGDVQKRDVYRLTFEIPANQKAIRAIKLEALPHSSLPASGPGLAYYEGRRGDFFLSELSATMDGEPLILEHPSISYGKIAIGSGSANAENVLDQDGSTGWSTAGDEGLANRWVANFANPIQGPGTLEIELLFERHYAAALGHFFIAVSQAPGQAVATVMENRDRLGWPDATQTDQQDPLLASHFGLKDQAVDVSAMYRRRLIKASQEFPKIRKSLQDAEKIKPPAIRTLVMQQRPPEDWRTTYRHHRGEYLQPAEPVTPDNLGLFGSLGPKYENDRLGFARFLVSQDNPLVGRVTMNRMWRHFFGTGIVRTAGDFGTQSEPPSHPDLLDWLALDWIRGGWSNKRMARQLVLSSTYGQAIGTPPASDPDNRLLSAYPYRRMSAEVIRDSMLSSAGLLMRRWGGPSVHPPQPASVSQLAYGKPNWPTSQDADRFRKSLYTFRRRTAPFAAYATFDAPTGEVCLARRDQSTNPLQALTLMNDGMFVEIAQAIAEDVQRMLPDGTPEQIADELFRRVLSRAPRQEELASLITFYEAIQDWSLTARAIMNTDEAITIP